MSKKPLTLRELQQLELEILKSFHSFCEEHQLQYSLAGGTLIGAIRHKGFIPWDDDIDVCMPRPDCMKLMALAKEGWIDEYRRIDYYTENPNALSATLRIYDVRTELQFTNVTVPMKFGCWIDVFALDGLSSDPRNRKRHFAQMRLLYDLFLCKITKFGGKRRSKLVEILQYGLLPALPFIKAVSNERYLKGLDRIAQRYPYEDAEYVGVLEGRAGEKEAMRKQDMQPAVLVDFEGEKFYAMANYDEYLTNLYGNYMELPPEDKRVSRHEIEFYWKDSEIK